MDTVDLIGDLTPLREEWSELADRLGAAPFARPGWFETWQAAFGSAATVVVAARRDGELAGVLPLRSRRGALASLTNWHTPEYRPLAVDARILEAMVGEALQRARGSLDLSFLSPADARTCADIARERGAVGEPRVIQEAPYVEIEGGWDAFEASLASRKRSKFKRALKRLEDAGDVSIEIEDGSGDLGAALEEGFAVEASGWKGQAGTSINAGADTLSFYRGIAEWASGEGLLRLYFLRLDGKTVAFGFGLDDGRAHYDLKNGFDPAYGQLSPGIALAAIRIRDAHERGLGRYEFLGGADRHKLDWTQSVHERVRIQVFAPSVRGHVERLAWTYGRRLRDEAKSLSGRLRQLRAGSRDA